MSRDIDNLYEMLCFLLGIVVIARFSSSSISSMVKTSSMVLICWF